MRVLNKTHTKPEKEIHAAVRVGFRGMYLDLTQHPVFVASAKTHNVVPVAGCPALCPGQYLEGIEYPKEEYYRV